MVGRMDDAALFQAWVGGDQSAGEALYGRYFDPLYRFFRAKVPDDYEDLIQNTMLECVRSRDRYRGDSPFRAYLFGVARHRLLHYMRAKGSNRLDFDAGQSSLADLDPRPSTVVARRAEHRLLLEAMRRIPVDLQLAIELHYWEDLSTAELAEVLEIPQGTVKSRLRRGREALQAALVELSKNPQERDAAVGGLETWVREIRELVGGK
jgi:RNA polymerase sigma factor (sigma-70 family)